MVSSKSKRKPGSTSEKVPVRQQSIDPQELREAGQLALDREDYQTAYENLSQAAEIAPQDTAIFEAYGALLAEMGLHQQAVTALERAVELSPDRGYAKYMYLGQLLEGDAAVKALQTGVKILEKGLAEPSTVPEEDQEDLPQQYAQALCSLAELRIQSDSATCGSDVEELLSSARAADPASPEPLQILASLRVEQGQPDAALALLKQSLALWFRDENSEEGAVAGAGDTEQQEQQHAGPSLGAVSGSSKHTLEAADAQGHVEEGADEDEEGMEEDEPELPSFEFRFQCAKLLLELEETTETTVKVLEGLVMENDGVLEVWYLLALALHAGLRAEEAMAALEEAERIMQKCRLPAEEVASTGIRELRQAIEESLALERQEEEAARDAVTAVHAA